MSFLSQHIAHETNTPDPVVGPNSPHPRNDGKAIYQGHVETPGRVVMGKDHKQVKEK